MWFLVTVAGIVWFFCQPPSFIRDRAILSNFLCCSLVGMLSIYLLPSGGPIFYEKLGFGNRFADLPILHVTQMTSDYLWRVHTGIQTNVGAGISRCPRCMSRWHFGWPIICPNGAFQLGFSSPSFSMVRYIWAGTILLMDWLEVAGAWLCIRIVDACLKRSMVAEDEVKLVDIRASMRGAN